MVCEDCGEPRRRRCERVRVECREQVGRAVDLMLDAQREARELRASLAVSRRREEVLRQSVEQAEAVVAAADQVMRLPWWRRVAVGAVEWNRRAMEAMAQAASRVGR